MSTARGNAARNRPQKHQNRTAFKNDLHDKSNKTKFLNTMEVAGVCKRCKDIIEWKIKYKKYKALTAPRKCVVCDQKSVKHAYHVLCKKCAAEKRVCAKCFTSNEGVPAPITEGVNTDIASILKPLPERKRRTILRFINKHQQSSDQIITKEMMTKIEDLISNMEKTGVEDSDDELNFSSDDE